MIAEIESDSLAALAAKLTPNAFKLTPNASIWRKNEKSGKTKVIA